MVSLVAKYTLTFVLVMIVCFHTVLVLRNPGEFVVQHHTKWCDAGTMLSTIDECYNAKAVLDPGADRVTNDNQARAPKGCSRHDGKWYFNTHEEGALDGESEPVCKTNAGN